MLADKHVDAILAETAYALGACITLFEYGQLAARRTIDLYRMQERW